MAKHEYKILSRNTQGTLATVVEEFLDAGYQLVGGVFVHEETVYVQPQGYAPVAEKITKFYQAVLRTTLPQPIVAVRGEHEEVVMYSEN